MARRTGLGCGRSFGRDICRIVCLEGREERGVG